jgi:hypothetical protein
MRLGPIRPRLANGRRIKMSSDYIEAAKAAGYEGTDEVLTRVGMAVELAIVAWEWYESGDDKYDIVGLFKYRDDKPNEADTIGAYAEGAFNE